MKPPKVKTTTTVEAPAAEVPNDYFVPPGYSSHVTAHRRLDYIKFSDHTYTKQAEILALIKWLELQVKTLAK